MPSSGECGTCLNDGCYSLCATPALKAIKLVTRLAFANYKQRRAINLGLNSPSPIPHQLRAIRREYKNANNSTLRPHYVSISKAASIGKEIDLSSAEV